MNNEKVGYESKLMSMSTLKVSQNEFFFFGGGATGNKVKTGR